MNVLEASGEPEGEGSDDLTGRTKSRLKSLKSRLFEKIRRKEDDGGLKQSQSESDITWGVEDSDCPTGTLGTRAFSHDSIFQAEQAHSDPEPLRILSQENIHGKIQALQVKLQQQKMHLGPPPLLLPIKRREDLGGSSEDDGLPRSPPEVSCGEGLYTSISSKFSVPPKNNSTLSLGGTGSEEEEQASSQPLSPRPISPAPLSPLTPGSVVDFGSPPQITSLLDNSAARHRMSLKPKNQRASAKNKRVIASDGSRTRSESLNNLDCSVATREEEEALALVKENPCARSYSSQVLRPREKLTATQIQSLPVSHLMSQQTAGDGRQVSAEPQLERNILSTSPPSPSLRRMPPAESPAAKLPIPVVPIDRKGKGEVSEMLTSFNLLKISQNNTVSTVRPNMTSTLEQSLVKDEKSNTVLIQNKMDTLSKYSVQSAVNIDNRQASTHASTNVICGIHLRPSSLRRKVPSTDDKHESKILHPVSTVAAVSQEGSQKETIRRQRTVSGSFHSSLSSDKNQERPRTASFTGVVGQAGLKKEAIAPTDPTLNFKTEQQVISQTEKKVKDTRANLPLSFKREDLVAPTKLIDLSKTCPRNLHAEEIQDNEKQEIRVEATEERGHAVEVVEEAGDDLMEDPTTGNAFGVKLRSTSLSLKFRLDKAKSEDKARPISSQFAEFSPQNQAPQSDSVSNMEPEDQHTGTGSIRGHAKLKDPPVRTDESSTTVQRSSLPPKSRDKERAGFLRQAEPPQPSTLASKDAKIIPSSHKEGPDFPPKETTAVSPQENPPTSAASEVSWMEMAREKTRSLQQLFTSRLPEFPSLQSRPTSFTTTQPQTQMSTSQANPRISQNIASQSTATEPPLKPTEITQPSGRSTQSTALLTQMQTKTTSQPLASLTSQPQTDSTRGAQFQSKMTTKPTQSTITCPSNAQSTVHTTKQSSQTWAPQTPPIPQASPLRAASQTPTQAILRPTPPPGPPHLLSSPKLISHLVSQQSTNTLSKDQPQNEGGEPTVISGKADRASVLQGRETGSEDGRPIWAAGLGNKTSLVQRWESQTTAGIKTGEQKATSESRTTTQSTVPFRPVSKVSGTGFDSSLSMYASVSSVPVSSTDREDKWQQKAVPPSSPASSSPLQSVRDSGQPSWMALAKRKSLAWSDKTMD